MADFTLRRTTGETVSLAGSLQGKKGAVVVFWSGTCSHCVRYDAYFNGFHARHPELAFMAVASRHGETLERIVNAVRDRRLAFPILLDPGGKVAAEYQTQQTPRAYLLDAGRSLVYRGAIDNYKYDDDPERQDYLEPAIAQFESGIPLLRPETASFGCAIQSVYYILPKAL